MSDLVIVPKGQPVSGDPEMKGWLFKWTNYLKGYQRRWFVLSNGLLSYYRNQAEMAHTCRGTISLLGALIHTVDSCTFVISNGGTQTFHIKASNEVERQSWVTALELAKAKAIRATESDDDEDSNECSGGVSAAGGEGLLPDGMCSADDSAARELATRFDDLRTCAELVARHGVALQRSLVELEVPPGDTAKQVAERATLFRIACNAMMNACSEYMQVAQNSCGRMGRALQHEREQKLRLQEVVEQLARQHDNLEKTVSARATSHSGVGHDSDEEDDHEFFDAQDDGPHSHSKEDNSFVIKLPVNRKKGDAESSDSEEETVTETQQVIFVEEERSGSSSTLQVGSGTGSDSMGGSDTGHSEETDGAAHSNGTRKSSIDPAANTIFPHPTQVLAVPGIKQRRTRVPEKPNYPLNLWSIMKNCIGKELSKIPIPVNFSEPLSMLQRLTEDYEYSAILDVAARCQDPAEQLAYVAAFTVSSYATTSTRTSKPFNPLLGETFECDRMEDLGWRALSEQVSHHPPMVAQFCEGSSGWQCWQEFTMTSKFRGKYLQVIPLGGAQCEFLKTGNTYTWRKVTTTVHNIIVGKLWMDQHGDMDIVGGGAAQGYTCHLKYLPYSYFSKDTQRKVTGVVKNPAGAPKYVIQGHWDSRIEVAPVTSTSPDGSVCKTGKFVTAWERIESPADSDKWYNFTLLAAQLNELEEGVAPTDTRHRPDQRLMEEGLWDEANTEKLRLEEKQRASRRQHEAAAEQAALHGLSAPPGPRPFWFERRAVATDAALRHVFLGDYWDCKQRQDWSRCPDIF